MEQMFRLVVYILTNRKRLGGSDQDSYKNGDIVWIYREPVFLFETLNEKI